MIPVEALRAYLENAELAHLVCRTIEDIEIAVADAVELVHRDPRARLLVPSPDRAHT